MKKIKKKKYVGLQKRKAISGYLFISPFIIGFLLFMIKPMFDSLYMSFCRVDLGAGSVDKVWIGLGNFYNAFRIDPEYAQRLTDELWRMVVYTFGIIVFSFFVALILNQEFKGRALVRAVFFLPVILSSGVILGLDQNNYLMGQLADTVEEVTAGVSITDAIQNILVTLGVGTRAFEVVFEIIDNIYDVAIASGIQIIIFLSGLQTISSSMYEAAQIEGCTKWESLWKITFPMISSLFLVNWIYTIVDFCIRSDNQVMDKFQSVMTVRLEYGLSSAMAWTYFAIVSLIIGVTSLIISKVVYYND
ncbi:MAG: sugar ABC transporter permease [Lachnospiraceae bacterium]|nr:sugar ABC transporter permease [Lachnospiraceae bacterium]